MGSLERFFYEVANVNPFAVNRVSQPRGADDADVPAIHDREFATLRGLANNVHRAVCTAGCVVWGDAGIGKSHLLARLCAWADAASPRGDHPNAEYVFLHNIQAAPERLPRYILKCVVSKLAGVSSARYRQSRLFALTRGVMHSAARKVPVSERARVPRGRARTLFLEAAESLVAQLPTCPPGALPVFRVLFEYFAAVSDAERRSDRLRVARHAVAWLSGDEINPKNAEPLGIEGATAGKGVALADNAMVLDVLTALNLLAWHEGQPMILCFDQVDNFDDPQMRAFSQFLHPLIDNSVNLLAITSGVQSKLNSFLTDAAQAIPGAAWARMAQHVVQLFPVGAPAARRLVETRLMRYLQEPFEDLPEVKSRFQADPLFPLGEAWWREREALSPDFRPRDVINWARLRFADEQRKLLDLGGAAWLTQTAGERAAPAAVATELAQPLEDLIDNKVETKITEQLHRRRLDPAGLPPDAANLQGLVEALLAQCRQSDNCPIKSVRQAKPKKPGTLPTYHLRLSRRGHDGSSHSVGLVFVVTGSSISAAWSMRRLALDKSPPDHVVLVTDARRKLPLGAAGRAHLQAVVDARGEWFRHIELAFDQYGLLDALQAVVGEARCGDLEITLADGRIRRVRENEVVASHQRQSRYRRSLLLCHLLDQPSPVSPAEATETAAPRHAEAGERHDVRQFIRAQLALTMGTSARAVARRYLDEHGQAAGLSLADCERLITDEAVQMHKKRQLTATPQDDDYFLLYNH